VSDTVKDVAMPNWHIELSHEDGWGFAQFASVNEKSELEIPADDNDGMVPFTGWRITLDKAGLAELIAKAQGIHDKLPG